jgi:single-stranded-DNA-specific exonuclease
MKFRWMLAPPQPDLAAELARALNISPLLAQCLLNRGLVQAPVIAGFLEPRLRHLADPFLLPNMGVAVDRLFRACELHEPMVIFGDYDVDGVASTALLLQVLGTLGWRANYYLPHRMDEGYGLSQDAVENCLRKHPVSVLLAVDCGSTTVESIRWLRERGVDVIVLDHHQISSPAPPATALVNPFLSDTSAAGSVDPLDGKAQTHADFRELCSVGLAFKLAHAVVKRGRQTGLAGAEQFDLRPLLDLVALGTIADVVPLTGENRILVSAGLARLNATQRPGLVELKRIAQCPKTMGPHEVGFQLAPRLNAAGRLEHAEAALQLLLAPDTGTAARLARDLDAHNRQRQKIERGIVDEVLDTLRTRFRPEIDFVIVEGRTPWHIGVVGIVASRVLQQFYRPTIIVGGDGAVWRGSGRSIAGFDLAAALRECSDLLVRHGGHAMAAGLTVESAKLELLRQRLNELARQTLKAEDLETPLRLDAQVGLQEMNLDCLAGLGRLRPVGQGNPAVQFCCRQVTHRLPPRRLGPNQEHVKMWVTDGRLVQEAVWWCAATKPLPIERFDLAFSPQLNQYNGRSAVQFKVLDWRPAV